MDASDMLSVVTYIKQGDAFIPLDEVTALNVKDHHYIDGSVRVSVSGQPLITDADWTHVVKWWAGMSTVLRHLSNGTEQIIEGSFFSWPGRMLFEVAGNRLTWTVRVPETRVATLDRVPALRILMQEYKRFFERMQVLCPCNNDDFDVALAYMSHFKPL